VWLEIGGSDEQIRVGIGMEAERRRWMRRAIGIWEDGGHGYDQLNLSILLYS
jgi:hypothetical protein